MTPEEEKIKRAAAKENIRKSQQNPPKHYLKPLTKSERRQVKNIEKKKFSDDNKKPDVSNPDSPYKKAMRKPQKTQTNDCPIPVGAKVKSRYKKGEVVKVDGNRLTILFNTGLKTVSYPECLSVLTFVITEKKQGND